MDFTPRKKKSNKKKDKAAKYGKFNSKHIRNRIVSEKVSDKANQQGLKTNKQTK